MILPVYVYGMPVLRKTAREVDMPVEDIRKLADDLYETMYATQGIGLAAPQVGKSLRMFVIDSGPMKESDPEVIIRKGAFVNPVITERFGDDTVFSEGCLSVPDINGDVVRKAKVRVEYYDEDMNFRQDEFEGLPARIIQHEYDHLDGRLFIDRLPPIRKMVIRRQLNDISKGKIRTSYKIVHP